GTGVCCKPADVAGVRWNLRMDEDDRHHGAINSIRARRQRPRDDPVLDPGGAGFLQCLRELGQRCARGHHIVDDRDAHPFEIELAGECTANVARAFAPGQRSLRRGGAFPTYAAADEPDPKLSGENPGDFESLVITALALALM